MTSLSVENSTYMSIFPRKNFFKPNGGFDNLNIFLICCHLLNEKKVRKQIIEIESQSL